MRGTMHITQQCAYCVHYSTMRILCTLTNNARTMYISQQCAYYVHYSTMRVLCSLVNNALHYVH